MLRGFAVVIMVALCPAVACCEQAEGVGADAVPEFETYDEMRTRFGELYAEGRLEEGAGLLEWALPRFPDNVLANSFNLAIVSCRLERYERAIEVMEYAHERGFWFNAYAMGADLWAPLRESARFEGVLERNEALRAESQKTSEPDRLVLTPEGYEEGKEYPLFIALHGGGSNIAEFRDVWTSEKLKTEFVVAHLQSSLLVGMGSYDWMQDLNVTRAEIADAYHILIEEYAIAENEVIVGGFSSGGAASLEVAFTNVVPVKGFVVLCPRSPDGFTDENVKAAHGRGLRGAILTTEMDPALEAQRGMADVLEGAGIPHRFVVTPDVGHWIPDDLGEQIDSSIDHIRGE